MRARLANVSAPHIDACTAKELKVSNTYAPDPIGGPTWKATCKEEVYECKGHPQLSSTVACQLLEASEQ